MDKASDVILSRYNKEIYDLALQLRQFVLKQLKGAVEVADTAASMIAYGYGPGYKDMICTMLLSKKGIKLGFYKGSELPDPDRLLTGSGKVHRYVEIKSEESLKDKALKNLITEALKAYKKRVG